MVLSVPGRQHEHHQTQGEAGDRRAAGTVVKPSDFAYASPTALAEATGLLARHEDAIVIAGGQSLLPLLKTRQITPSLLVDLRRVESLGDVAWGTDTVTIGATVTQRHLELDPLIAQRVPLLGRVLPLIGQRQTRARGTVAGSVAQAQRGAEIPAVLVSLDGTVHVTGEAGRRSIAAADFYLAPPPAALGAPAAPLTAPLTTLRRGEIITAVELPLAPPRTGTGAVEVAWRPNVSVAGALAQVAAGPDGRVGDARIALIGLADRPLRAAAAERALTGAVPGDGAAQEAGAAVEDEIERLADAEELHPYARRVAAELTRRAVAIAFQEVS
jgi:aerobic carbon-monoxide dehydrogenase medium subunit